MVVWPHILGQSIMVVEVTEEFLHLIEGGKQQKGNRKGPRTICSIGLSPTDLLPPSRSHLLKFPETPKIALVARNLGFNAGRRHFIFKP
jgi:hypothetical protein